MSAIAKKLMMKPGSRWLLYNAPLGYPDLLQPLPKGINLFYDINGEFDGVQTFVKNSAELIENLKLIVPVLKLKKETIFWITYPKKSSGIPTDLEMMGSWDELGTYGLNGIAAAAINETWTALRFRPKELSKKSDTCNEEITKNDYSRYIDVTNKQIILPADILAALQNNPKAMNTYQSLSYSNRKEYVLWILTAKQDITKVERLQNMVKKLIAGKKNPSEK